MVIGLIFFLLIFSGLASFLLKKRGVRTAHIWMIFVFASLISWLIILIISTEKISPLIINNWFIFGNTAISLKFGLTSSNWMIALSILAFNLAFFLTGIARLDVKTDLEFWIFQVLLTATSFLAVIAADLWSVAFLWTALDILDLVFNLRNTNRENRERNFLRICFKFLGSLFLISNIASLSTQGFNPLKDGLVAITSNTTLFLAALLHSGIFPFKPSDHEFGVENKVNINNSTFYTTNFIVSFSLILTLASPQLSFIQFALFSFIGFFSIVFMLTRWIFIQNVYKSILYLLAAEVGSFLILYINGATQYIGFSLASIFLIVLGLVLYTHREKTLVIFPILNLFFISGLPFSLSAFGVRGFIKNEITLGMFFLYLKQIFLILGYINHSFKKNKNFFELETMYQAIYLSGLFLPLLTISAIIIKSISNDYLGEFQFWWVGLSALLISVAGYLIIQKRKSRFVSLLKNQENKTNWIWEILNFKWLERIMHFLNEQLAYLISGISSLLESKGGILWALVLLTLIVTIIIK